MLDGRRSDVRYTMLDVIYRADTSIEETNGFNTNVQDSEGLRGTGKGKGVKGKGKSGGRDVFSFTRSPLPLPLCFLVIRARSYGGSRP